MSKHETPSLSRRERQIMDIIYAQGSTSAAEVREALPDAPSDSAVRTLLRLLEEKGHVKHAQVGRKYVYSPVVTAKKASHSALRNLLQTFFQDSVEQTLASLLDMKSSDLSDTELERLSALISQARKQGKKS